MQKGFYDLTSGMLTQNRILNNISNNLGNISTPGYKRDLLMTKTFDDRMQLRTGNRNKNGKEELHEAAMMRTVDEVYTVHEQGAFEDTGRSLDFAISGDAFFAVEGFDGKTYYSRNGSFTLDGDGAVMLQNVGYVLGKDNRHIIVKTDKLTADSKGNLFNGNNELLGSIGMVSFEDSDRLKKYGQGTFINEDAGNIVQDSNSYIKQGFLEASNVDLTDAFADMISSQRAFQSASQVLKMYDELMNQTVTAISRIG
ncbi:MAG: flagellar hook-basal body protein [Anaerovoracaceae bacterium]